ncbi:hypothetical protein MPER_07353 [Moniliophthora perniciosa FA553]|nr:hypothetical protein MPER_07353 [Moniliophthora perniciosa FA553]
MVGGETISIRLLLGGFDLTPTFRDVNKKFSTRYYVLRRTGGYRRTKLDEDDVPNHVSNQLLEAMDNWGIICAANNQPCHPGSIQLNRHKPSKYL